MPDKLLGLGEFRFSISTAAYEKLQHSAEYNWAAIERFGQFPARQFTGLGAESITLDGVIYPYFKGGLGQVTRMREIAAKGEPLTMAGGDGSIFGLWVIESIEENQEFFAINGTPRKVSFSIKLSKYGEDR